MNEHPDPVERAMNSLKSQEWLNDGNRAELEEKLMNTFHTPTKSSRFTKYRTLMVTLAIVLVGGISGHHH